MVIDTELKDKIFQAAQQASARAAFRYDRRRAARSPAEAWQDACGFVVLQLLERIHKMRSLPVHFYLWLQRSSHGEARKYYRFERRKSLV